MLCASGHYHSLNLGAQRLLNSEQNLYATLLDSRRALKIAQVYSHSSALKKYPIYSSVDCIRNSFGDFPSALKTRDERTPITDFSERSQKS